MGIGVRFYIWNDNKGFRRYPRTSFVKSYHGIPNKDFIEYAGTRIKYVMVYLEMESRRPIEIRHIDCGIFTVDDDGKFNQDEVIETKRLAMESLVTPAMAKFIHDTDSNVVWSTGLFAIKKSKELYSWELTGNQLNQLIEDIFNKET